MSNHCLKCGAILLAPWTFCPTCGTRIQPHGHPTPTESEKAPVKHAFSGLMFGLIVTPMCLIVGGIRLRVYIDGRGWCLYLAV